MKTYTIEQVPLIHFLTRDKRSAVLWLLIRLYVGYEWLIAGWEKVMNPVWFGSQAGPAVKGFVAGALLKTGGQYPDVSGWYASFLQSAVLPNALVWANLVAVGELLVGLGLIAGFLTGIAAFFGFFMNLNYLLAGTVSSNPQLLVLALLLMAARYVAGYWGLDRYKKSLPFRKFGLPAPG